jgi:hypothetical protein
VGRLLVSTQKRNSPKRRVGTASCPDQVRLANGTRFTCTVRIEGATAPYAVTLPRRRRRRDRRPLRPPTGQADHRRHPHRQPDPQQAPAHRPRRHRPLRRRQGPGGRDRRLHRLHHPLGDAVQKVTAVVKDLEGTVVVRG